MSKPAVQVKRFGTIADFALYFGVALATVGVFTTYFNVAMAVRLEGVALILIALSAVATVRGLFAVLNGSGYYSKPEPDLHAEHRKFDRITQSYYNKPH